MNNAIKFNGYITSIRSRKDRSLGFSGETPELDPEEMIAFMRLQGINLDVTLEPLDEPYDDVIKIDKQAGLKSPSERLFNVIYAAYMQTGGTKDQARDFYLNEMEKIIKHYRDKLE